MDYDELLDDLGNPEIIPFKEETGTQSKGAYFPDFNLIFVNDKYSDIDRENIIMHELGHRKFGHVHNALCAPSVKIKQEAQADQYMIQLRAVQWLNAFDNSWEEEDINIYNFLNYFHFSRRYYEMAEKSFRNLMTR